MKNLSEQEWNKKPKHAASSQNLKNQAAYDAHRGKHAKPESSPAPTQGRHATTIDMSKGRSKGGKIVKRVLLVLLALILVVLAAGAGIFFWYSSQLDNVLAMDDQTQQAVDEVLVPAEAGKPFYVLILGSDSREGSGTSSSPANSGDNERSDVIMLVRVDASNKQMTMVSVPRDTPYYLEDGSVIKINETYNMGGEAYTIKAVSELTGADISYFASVRFSGFEAIIDYLGGITVNVPQKISYKDALTGEKVTVKPGVQTINGQEAQIFARSRKQYEDDQEGRRQSNNRQIVEGIMNKLLEKPVTEIPETVLELASYVTTNMKTADIVSMIVPFALGSGDFKLYGGTGPKTGDIRPEAGDSWLCYDNPEGWAQVMAVVDAGEDPSGLDVEHLAIKNE